VEEGDEAESGGMGNGIAVLEDDEATSNIGLEEGRRCRSRGWRSAARNSSSRDSGLGRTRPLLTPCSFLSDWWVEMNTNQIASLIYINFV
jgi:hypothetical protein